MALVAARGLGLEKGKTAFAAGYSRWRRRAETNPQWGWKASRGFILPLREALGPRKAKGTRLSARCQKTQISKMERRATYGLLPRQGKARVGPQKSESSLWMASTSRKCTEKEREKQYIALTSEAR